MLSYCDYLLDKVNRSLDIRRNPDQRRMQRKQLLGNLKEKNVPTLKFHPNHSRHFSGCLQERVKFALAVNLFIIYWICGSFHVLKLSNIISYR